LDNFNLNIKTDYNPQPGMVLIAEPFLQDPSFERSVVFVCEHDEQGTFGLIMNKLLEEPLGALVPELDGFNISAYFGGPVEEHTLHILHTLPKQLGGTQLFDNVYLGSDLDSLLKYFTSEKADFSRVKFFIGYSGWGSGQLMDEIDTNAWLVAPTTSEILFSSDNEEFYKKSLEYLGGEYKNYFMLPRDPSLN
jgi:putative transcriptional regulator